MIPLMVRRNPPTSNEAIAAFEREAGLSLPAAYKRFLLATNGGRPERSALDVEAGDRKIRDNVHEFFGISPSPPLSDLTEMFEWFRSGVPKGVVLIGGTDGNDYLCLDLRQGTDRVAYWDHRHHWGTGEWRESDLHQVADSFEEFLAALKPNPY